MEGGAPTWVRDAVFYAVNPDRFARDPAPGPHPWDEGAFEAWDAPPEHRAYKGGDLPFHPRSNAPTRLSRSCCRHGPR